MGTGLACIRRRQRLVIVSGYGQMYQHFVQTVLCYLEELRYARYYQVTIQAIKHTIVQAHGHVEKKWLRKSEQGDKWNRCLIEGMIVLSETGARDEQTTPP